MTFTGLNAWKGTVTENFYILAPVVEEMNAYPEARSIGLVWKKSKGATGYEIEYSTRKNMWGAKKVKVKAVICATIKDLKPGKTYYVRIRPIAKVNGKTYESGWAGPVPIATKSE